MAWLQCEGWKNEGENRFVVTQGKVVKNKQTTNPINTLTVEEIKMMKKIVL